MLILNATREVKSILTERGDIITILPGQVSRTIIASRHLILSAINLGNPNQIGIILSGSYEMELAKQITGAVPYLYVDVDEAKSKLIDPSIDYVSTLKVNKVTQEHEMIIAEKDKIINELNANLIELQKQLDQARVNDHIVALQTELSDANKFNLELQSLRDKLQSQVTEAQDNIQILTTKNNKLSEDLSVRVNELKSYASVNSELQSKNKELQEQMKSSVVLKDDEVIITKEDLNNLETKISELKGSLADSAETIETMKSEFNTACNKFNITKNESGEWIQVAE